MASLQLLPDDALVDDGLTIRASDVPPAAELVLDAEATHDGQTWRSSGPIAAGTAVDGTPWLWSLDAGEVGRDAASDAPWRVRFRLRDGDDVLADATAVRRFVGAGVERVELTDGDLRGTFYGPSMPATDRAALVLSGGNGGQRADVAALLASRGVPSLALALFAFPGRPQWPAELPLEYVDAAVAWLLDASGARAVATVGQSMGGCLALLVASQHPDVEAACSINGCGWVPQVRVTAGATSGPVTSWWSRGGRPIPFTGPDAPPELRERARIPVERIVGDVLLLTGDDDQTWTATAMAEDVARWRRDAGRPVTHVDYPGAGHLIAIPNAPHTVRVFEMANGYRLPMGGTPEIDARASADGWARLLRLLLGT